MRDRANIFLPLAVLLSALFWAGGWSDEPRQPGPSWEALPLKIDGLGIESFYQLSPRIYSSGEPQGAKDFAALASLGIKTIISVDGTPPDVEAAKKHGIRYVHLPMGYGGVPKDEGVKIAKVIESSLGPVLIHCHHGKHRGPAAAAVGCIAREGWTSGQALAWLKQAGTSPDYRQLFADVAAFRPPSRGELDGLRRDLPERVEPPPLVDAMLEIDNAFDKLRALAGDDWKNLSDKDRAAAQHEATLLHEQFRELARLQGVKEKPRDFGQLITEASASTQRLHSLLESVPPPSETESLANRREELGAATKAVAKSCTSCHAKYRNGSPD